MRRLGYRPDALVEALHSVQDSFGYLDRDALVFVAGSLRVPPSRVYGVATFYSYFSLKPPGAHTCVVCMGTACYINGAPALLEAFLLGGEFLLAETSVRGGPEQCLVDVGRLGLVFRGHGACSVHRGVCSTPHSDGLGVACSEPTLNIPGTALPRRPDRPPPPTGGC